MATASASTITTTTTSNNNNNKQEIKILSFNINGIKSVCVHYGGIAQLLSALDADIVCFQETKVNRSTISKDVAVVAGYRGYFSFTRGARSAYSGTATFVREGSVPVLRAQDGITGVLSNHGDDIVFARGGDEPADKDEYDEEYALATDKDEVKWSIETLQHLDGEGRCVVTDHGEFVLLNVYAPAYSEVGADFAVPCTE